MKYSLLILLITFLGCEPFPRDTNNSFEKALNTQLVVGIALNPPYTSFRNDSFSGSEIELIRRFARINELEVKFMEGTESELIEKMKNYEVHIIAGGIEKGTAWKQEARPSAPYDKNHVFLVPKGENRLLKEVETFIFQKVKNQ